MGGCFATDGRLAPCGYRPSVDALLDLDAGAIGTPIRPAAWRELWAVQDIHLRSAGARTCPLGDC